MADRLFATLYGELRRLADFRVRSDHGAAAVSPTTLVHETYLNMARRRGNRFPDPRRFLTYAARAMHGLLVDIRRRKHALKRGAGVHVAQLDAEVDVQSPDGAQLQRLTAALDTLAALDPGLAELVNLKYFCGLSFTEIAALRGISERTVQRDWDKARLLLYREMGED
jgi:RNA polymerase sigma factor (TIGR02999 family)